MKFARDVDPAFTHDLKPLAQRTIHYHRRSKGLLYAVHSVNFGRIHGGDANLFAHSQAMVQPLDRTCGRIIQNSPRTEHQAREFWAVGRKRNFWNHKEISKSREAAQNQSKQYEEGKMNYRKDSLLESLRKSPYVKVLNLLPRPRSLA
jgi:hypothetical protein